ncbi:hypothetical protein BGX24_012358 [Mortierella sp. AD032]|nr:hypothetical protein BGX24_012358 [Mortierella sp. AD032]
MTVHSDTLNSNTQPPPKRAYPTVANTTTYNIHPPPPAAMLPTDQHLDHHKGSPPHQNPHTQPRPKSSSLLSSWLTGSSNGPGNYNHHHPHPHSLPPTRGYYHPGPANNNAIHPRHDSNILPPPPGNLAASGSSSSYPVHINQWNDPRFHRDRAAMGNYALDYDHRGDERTDVGRAPYTHPHPEPSRPSHFQHYPSHEPFARTSPIDATASESGVWTFTELPLKRKGRKPKVKPEGDEDDTEPSAAKDKKPKVPKEPKPPKEPKEKKVKEPKPPKEPKLPKESKPPKEPKPPKESKESKQKKPKKNENGDGGANSGAKPERSILSFFDRSNVGSAAKASGGVINEEHRGESSMVQSSASKSAFKQSCLSFDVLDPSKAGNYVNMAMSMDDRSFGGIMKELPKLTGRAPYEDLISGLLLRSSKLPALNKLDLHHPELDMDMLADVKMVHEFLNTFGTPLGLTKDSGEWITFDLLLSMIRNPRIDSRLVDLSCKMVMAAYEDDESPEITQFNFPYFLATGPEAVAARKERKDIKKNKWALMTASKKKIPFMSRLGTIEYSVYTVADRIEALVKALHDITSSPRFHRFMREEVEENITSLKRHKRKRTEARKELETTTHDLERDMKAIEREAAELEKQRQEILNAEREGGQAEDENAGGKTLSRQQRLAQAKDARNKANDLLNQQKALAQDLKVKESLWETKKEELDETVLDDTELQKDHNVPLTQLRGGHVVNTDEKLRVICLGSDRWGRKYWFWKEFGGVIIEDREQVGPDLTKTSTSASTPAEDTNQETTTVDRQDAGLTIAGTETKPDTIVEDTTDSTMHDVTQRMKTMAQPDLAGEKFRSTKDAMSIDNLLTGHQTPEVANPFMFGRTTTTPATPLKPLPEKDLLDYGPIQTWSLISTSKELASMTRALNGKGVRERVLKASLMTMRKEIEASFDLIKTWAGREHAGKKEQLVSILGAVGQPLSEQDLMLLLKKRGRKSRQELADIAATQHELAVAEGEDKVMEVDGGAGSADESSSHMDVDMTDEHSEDVDHELIEDNDDAEIADADDETESGFLALVAPLDSGLTTAEYFGELARIAEEKVKELSAAICDGDKEAISNAVRELQLSIDGGQDNWVLATVKVLEHCLEAMDEPESIEEDMEEGEGQVGGEREDSLDQKNGEKTESMEQDERKETSPTETTPNATVEGKEAEQATPPFSIHVHVNPGLLNWLTNYHIDTMLKDVRTFGALHAWIDACTRLVANVVYDADENDEDEENMDGRRNKDHDADEGEDHDHEDEEEEDEDEEENDQDDDEGEDAGDDKGADDSRQEEEDEGENDDRRNRQRKPRQQAPTQVEGRTLRSRGKVSYAYTVVAEEESEEEEDEDESDGDEDEEESEDEAPLRRSKRIRH